MIYTIEQANEEFIKKFRGIQIMYQGSPIDVLTRFYKKSAHDYVEEQKQQVYPVVAIQPYAPVLSDEWFTDLKKYFGGKDFDAVRAYLYRRSLRMDFRYDVSHASKSGFQHYALQDYFLQHYIAYDRFFYNEVFDGEGYLGDLVAYEIRQTDVPRIDGVHETNYEFTCKVWINPVTAEEVDLVFNIIWNLYQIDFYGNGEFIPTYNYGYLKNGDGYILNGNSRIVTGKYIIA